MISKKIFNLAVSYIVVTLLYVVFLLIAKDSWFGGDETLPVSRIVDYNSTGSIFIWPCYWFLFSVITFHEASCLFSKKKAYFVNAILTFIFYVLSLKLCTAVGIFFCHKPNPIIVGYLPSVMYGRLAHMSVILIPCFYIAGAVVGVYTCRKFSKQSSRLASSGQGSVGCISTEKTDLTKEEPLKRKLPAIVDIFFYPTTTSGLLHTVAFWILPQLIVLFLPIFSLQLIAISIVFFYMCYFFMKCIRNSAAGEIRVATGVSTATTIGSEVTRTVGVFVSIIMCLIPYIIYLGDQCGGSFVMLLCYGNDTVAWILLGCGLFFIPIALLAVSVFNSISAINPIEWIVAISKTFFQYCGMILLFLAFNFFYIKLGSRLKTPLLSVHLYLAVYIYATMVEAHVLGRFYCRNSQKLNWK